MEAPRSPRRVTPSWSCSAASSGCWNATDAIATNRVGVGGHPLRQSLVLRPHDRAGELTVPGVPPEPVDGERLHVDALLIHDPESFRAENVGAAATAHFGKW